MFIDFESMIPIYFFQVIFVKVIILPHCKTISPWRYSISARGYHPALSPGGKCHLGITGCPIKGTLHI